MSTLIRHARRLLLRWTVALCTLLATLVASETTLRFIWAPPSLATAHPLGPHPEYLKAILPGASGVLVRPEYAHSFHNSLQGLRAEEIYTRELPPGTSARVLVLGDSFVFGQGVEEPDTFVALLHRRRPDVQFINGGCPAWGTRDELMLLDRLGEALRPNVVLLGFFENDVKDNLHARPKFELDPQGHLRRLDTQGIVRADDPLALRPATPARFEGSRYTPYLYHLWLQAVANARYWWFPEPPITLEQFNRDWLTTREYLNMFAVRAREIGAQPVVVYIPFSQEIYPPGTHPPRPYDRLPVGDTLAQSCVQLGLPLIDLRPSFKQARSSSSPPLYWHADLHWTARGHEVAAESIGPALDAWLPLR